MFPDRLCTALVHTVAMINPYYLVILAAYHLLRVGQAAEALHISVPEIPRSRLRHRGQMSRSE
jgi:hypothetical protein